MLEPINVKYAKNNSFSTVWPYFGGRERCYRNSLHALTNTPDDYLVVFTGDKNVVVHRSATSSETDEATP